jgi:hypothetical protein
MMLLAKLTCNSLEKLKMSAVLINKPMVLYIPKLAAAMGTNSVAKTKCLPANVPFPIIIDLVFISLYG